jgi:hypothetical protein
MTRELFLSFFLYDLLKKRNRKQGRQTPPTVPGMKGFPLLQPTLWEQEKVCEDDLEIAFAQSIPGEHYASGFPPRVDGPALEQKPLSSGMVVWGQSEQAAHGRPALFAIADPELKIMVAHAGQQPPAAEAEQEQAGPCLPERLSFLEWMAFGLLVAAASPCPPKPEVHSFLLKYRLRLPGPLGLELEP